MSDWKERGDNRLFLSSRDSDERKPEWNPEVVHKDPPGVSFRRAAGTESSAPMRAKQDTKQQSSPIIEQQSPQPHYVKVRPTVAQVPHSRAGSVALGVAALRTEEPRPGAELIPGIQPEEEGTVTYSRGGGNESVSPVTARAVDTQEETRRRQEYEQAIRERNELRQERDVLQEIVASQLVAKDVDAAERGGDGANQRDEPEADEELRETSCKRCRWIVLGVSLLLLVVVGIVLGVLLSPETDSGGEIPTAQTNLTSTTPPPPTEPPPTTPRPTTPPPTTPPPTTPPPTTPQPTHYGSPHDECLADEQNFTLTDAPGTVCAPPCNGSPCPTDVPAGVTAVPACVIQNTLTDEWYCALICNSGQCGEATCHFINGTGVCTYL